MSNLSAERPEEEGEEELQEDSGNQKEAASPIACDPSLTEVQATSTPSSNLNTACMYQLLLIHLKITQQFEIAHIAYY